jgi:hypothetical protein
MYFSKHYRNQSTNFAPSTPHLAAKGCRDVAGSKPPVSKKIEISIVAAEEPPPHFQTILAGGEK